MVGLDENGHIRKLSPKIVNPWDIAGNALEEEEQQILPLIEQYINTGK